MVEGLMKLPTLEDCGFQIQCDSGNLQVKQSEFAKTKPGNVYKVVLEPTGESKLAPNRQFIVQLKSREDGLDSDTALSASHQTRIRVLFAKSDIVTVESDSGRKSEVRAKVPCMSNPGVLSTVKICSDLKTAETCWPMAKIVSVAPATSKKMGFNNVIVNSAGYNLVMVDIPATFPGSKRSWAQLQTLDLFLVVLIDRARSAMDAS